MVKLLARGFTKIGPLCVSPPNMEPYYSYKAHDFGLYLLHTSIHTYIYLLMEGDLQVQLPKFSQNHNWKN
jgi:hypothetical protein